MNNPVDLPGIRAITISGRISAGSTSLAKHLANMLSWKLIEGGELFWENVRKKMRLAPKDTNLRPDEEDLLFDEQLKQILRREQQMVLETKLSGFIAKDLKDVFKILVISEDLQGQDQTQVRIDRLVNREQISIPEAKAEVIEREANDIEKWRRLYTQNDPQWAYWDKKYYDLIVNTFTHNQEESLKIVLEAIGFKK